jgi:hypothetical protein
MVLNGKSVRAHRVHIATIVELFCHASLTQANRKPSRTVRQTSATKYK